MVRNTSNAPTLIPSWHRNLLVLAAIFTVLLIAMGGILCMTQSIRDCPDWPGCFGKIYPPLETGPVLEYTHRLLAALSGLLILSSAIAGLIRKPRLRLIAIPPLVSVGLLLLVSYFGAVVVLRGLTPGWAAVDVGAALLVVALMVTSAVFACGLRINPAMPDHLDFSDPLSRLILATTLVVYGVLVSGVLVAGKNPLVACLGWPVYSPTYLSPGGLSAGNVFRLFVSIIGIGMVIAVFLQAWRKRKERIGIYKFIRWFGITFVLEATIQVVGVASGFSVILLVLYTAVAAVLWGSLVAALAWSALEGQGHMQVGT